MLIKANGPFQVKISNKLHKFQQITKQGKVNVQRKANGKNNYDILIFLNIYVFLYTYMYMYYYYYYYFFFC